MSDEDEISEFVQQAIEELVNAGALPYTEESFEGEKYEEQIWRKATELWEAKNHANHATRPRNPK